MSSDQELPYDSLWHTHFPFEYWYNRLEKINPHNERDRLEALYSLVELAEMYSRAFSALIQNPNYPWYYLDDHLTAKNVEGVFKALQFEADTVIGKASEISGATTPVDTEVDVGLPETDAVAVSLLGIPYEFDETGQIELSESLAFHRNICGTILEIAERQESLKGSFDQGFRVFPVSPETVETVINSSGLVSEANREPVQRQIEELRKQNDDDRWPLTYFHFNREATEDGSVLQLQLNHVDAWTCYKLAEVVLDALFNLITPGPGYGLESVTSDVPIEVIEGDSKVEELIFEIETPIDNDPPRIVTEENLDQSS